MNTPGFQDATPPDLALISIERCAWVADYQLAHQFVQYVVANEVFEKTLAVLT